MEEKMSEEDTYDRLLELGHTQHNAKEIIAMERQKRNQKEVMGVLKRVE